MSDMSDDLENGLLALIFNNTAYPDVGDASGLQPAGTPGSLYVALHTSTGPGEAGTQDTNECAYTGYSRVAVARSGAGWTVSGDQVSNAAAVTFGQKTAGGDETATYFSIGKETSGATEVLFHAALTASRLISNGDTPEFAIGDLTVTLA